MTTERCLEYTKSIWTEWTEKSCEKQRPMPMHIYFSFIYSRLLYLEEQTVKS